MYRESEQKNKTRAAICNVMIEGDSKLEPGILPSPSRARNSWSDEGITPVVTALPRELSGETFKLIPIDSATFQIK